MAVSSRLIKRRIRSVANTRKITKAMELVAASKMRKSVSLAQNSRAYTGELQAVTDRIAHLVDPRVHQLLSARQIPQKSLVIVLSSDRGLCGAFNAQAVKSAIAFLKSRTEEMHVVTVGRRADSALRRAGMKIDASFEAISNAPSFDRSLPIGRYASQQFLSGAVDRVFVCYLEFRSSLSQVPTVKQLIPALPEMNLQVMEEEETVEDPHIQFEPSSDTVLEVLLPRLVDVQVYQSLLESSASEHSSRMFAMRNATNNATEMLADLTFTYNQARQASITREISEISAGAAAIH